MLRLALRPAEILRVPSPSFFEPHQATETKLIAETWWHFLIDDSDSVIVDQRASTRVKISWFLKLESRHDSVLMKLEILGVIFRGLTIIFKRPSSRDLGLISRKLEKQRFSSVHELARLICIPIISTTVRRHFTPSLGFVVKHLRAADHNPTESQNSTLRFVNKVIAQAPFNQR
jgi:hypothetical protein